MPPKLGSSGLQAGEHVTRTGGRWNPKAWPTYFGASTLGTLELAADCLSSLLVAVNELGADNDVNRVVAMIDAGKDVLVDSGVYWLSTQHAKNHDITMDIALGLAPDEIDGFDDLFERYVRLVTLLESRAWGYIEIDQGGRENKIKTRAKLEKMGFRPIPVYHPLNDGWDYFDYLAENYDRICMGNVVNAEAQTRKRLVATAWERRRKYPDLWIHLLGLTPSELTVAFPCNSCDSSTWVANVRWGTHSSSIASKRMTLDEGFIYEKGNYESWSKAIKLCGYDAQMTGRTMKRILNDQKRELGADPTMRLA